MKDFIVTFGSNGARIVKGINPADWVGHPNVAVNPDLSKVQGIPPEKWKLVGSEVQPSENAASATPTVTTHMIELDETFLKAHIEQFHKLPYNLIIATSAGTACVAALVVDLILWLLFSHHGPF